MTCQCLSQTRTRRVPRRNSDDHDERLSSFEEKLKSSRCKVGFKLRRRYELNCRRRRRLDGQCRRLNAINEATDAFKQSNVLRPYLAAVRSSLTAALTLENFSSQVCLRPSSESGPISCSAHLGRRTTQQTRGRGTVCTPPNDLVDTSPAHTADQKKYSSTPLQYRAMRTSAC